MWDYYDGSSMRPDDPWLYNGGRGGWGSPTAAPAGPAELHGLHQRGPISELDNIQNQMKNDMDDYMKDKDERLQA